MSSLHGDREIHSLITFEKLVEMIEKWKIVSCDSAYTTRCNKAEHVTIMDMQKKLFAHGECNCNE